MAGGRRACEALQVVVARPMPLYLWPRSLGLLEACFSGTDMVHWGKGFTIISVSPTNMNLGMSL